MGLDKLVTWIASLIIVLSTVYNLEVIHKKIIKVQAILLYESRTETWGSPRFLQIPESKTLSRSNDSTATRK